MRGHDVDRQDDADAYGNSVTQIVFIDGSIAGSSYAGDVDSSTTNSTTHSLSIAIGAVAGVAEGARLVAVAIGMLSSNGNPIPDVSAATIGGVTAAWGTTASASRTTGRYSVVWIWALVPTGTTATVAITLTQSALVRLRSFRVVGLLSTTPGHNDEDSNVGNITSLVGNINVVFGGIALAACAGFGTGTWTITGVTEDYSVSGAWSTDGRLVGGHLDVSADETARAVTITTGSFATTAISLAILAFR